jgi:hypothetical protein
VVQTLKARLDALHAEMTKTDSPEYNIQLKHEEEIIQALIERLGLRSRDAGAEHSQRTARPSREAGDRDEQPVAGSRGGQCPPSSR